MSASQRRDLRKSLVDEVFEELIQRHHDRVLDQLKLDTENFIAPTASNGASPESTQENKLKKCVSIDLKDLDKATTASKKKEEKRPSEASAATATTGGLKAALMSHAKKYSEVFNRKYFGNGSGGGRNGGGGSDGGGGKSAESGKVSLSSAVSSTSFDLLALDRAATAAGNTCSGHYIKKLDCDGNDDDEDDVVTDRRLRRSQIIQSFLEQSDLNPEEDEDDFNEAPSAAANNEPSSFVTRI